MTEISGFYDGYKFIIKGGRPIYWFSQPKTFLEVFLNGMSIEEVYPWNPNSINKSQKDIYIKVQTHKSTSKNIAINISSIDTESPQKKRKKRKQSKKINKKQRIQNQRKFESKKLTKVKKSRRNTKLWDLHLFQNNIDIVCKPICKFCSCELYENFEECYECHCQWFLNKYYKDYFSKDDYSEDDSSEYDSYIEDRTTCFVCGNLSSSNLCRGCRYDFTL